MSEKTENPAPFSSSESPLFCSLDAHRVMLQTIVDHSPADIYLKDLGGKYLLVNRNFGDRMEQDPTSVIGKTVFDCFSEAEAEEKAANDETVIREGKARQFEEVVTMDDGPHTLLSEKFPVRDETGVINGVCGISTDITTRKADEEKLRWMSRQIQQQSRTLETVLSASPNIVYMFDARGRFLYANQSGATHFAVRSVDMIGKTLKSLKRPEGVYEPLMLHLAQVFKTGKTIEGQLDFSTPAGRHELAYTLIPIMDIRGRVVNGIAYVNDITLEREKDRMLKAQTMELNRSSDELEDFARVASISLNDPLNIIQNYLSLLEKSLGDSLSDESRSHLERTRNGTARMKALMDDLIEYSRVGLKAEAYVQLSMNEIVDAAKGDLETRIQKSKATISVDKLPTVLGIASQIKQVWVHLISNALKYNKSGSPKVNISVAQNNDLWVFSISDNGIGIEAKDTDRIFQIFQRLHVRHAYSGTGIGLAVCRKIVQQHEGDIWLESEPGEGTTFFFGLPIRYKGGHQMMIDLFEET